MNSCFDDEDLFDYELFEDDDYFDDDLEDDKEVFSSLSVTDTKEEEEDEDDDFFDTLVFINNILNK